MFFFYSLITDAYALGAQQQSGDEGVSIPTLIFTYFPLVAIFIIMYLLLIRPQQKKAKKHKEMVDNIKKGDKIITSCGIYGVIEAIGIETITVKISESLKVKIAKNHLVSMRSAADEG